ncbi:MAG: hypothetical protein QOF76_408 [Solirubrobacteraceae bacterium]|jgi:heme-degrading monooxygenase HmoA|nr:hypothetical protein [Solirubrobacteraceae bacterium]
MHARLSRFMGLGPERVAQLVEAYREGDYVGEVAGRTGFAGYVVAEDPLGGRLMAMSVWDDAGAMAASDDIADSQRAQRIADSKPARHPHVGRFEIAVRRGEPGEQRFIRVSRLSGLAPHAVRTLVAAYEETDYLEHLAAYDGFAGYLLLTAEDEVLAMSFWMSQEDRGASDEMAAAARALRIKASRPEDEPVVERYEVALLRRPHALA